MVAGVRNSPTNGLRHLKVHSPGMAALRRVLADLDRCKHGFWRSALGTKGVESNVCLQDPAECGVSAEASLASLRFKIQQKQRKGTVPSERQPKLN